MIFSKPFGVPVLVCQLPKETALFAWGTENPLYWEQRPKVHQGVLGTSITMPNTLPSLLYQYLTLCATFGPFQHLTGAKMAILAPKCPLGRWKTILHILNWLETHPKVVNT